MRNVPQYLLNGSRYSKEIYFCIIRDCFACFDIFLCLHTLPWQPFFQLVTKSRNEQSHLDVKYVVTCYTCMMQHPAKHMDIRHAQ